MADNGGAPPGCHKLGAEEAAAAAPCSAAAVAAPCGTNSSLHSEPREGAPLTPGHCAARVPTVAPCLQAHRDVDEEATIAGGAARFPTRVVLLYGSVRAGLRAPTMLWCPGAAGGGDGGALLAVPAVAGRMLVFEGSLLHAAPSPAELLGEDSGEAEEEEEELERCITVLNLWEGHAPALLDDDEEDEDEDGEGGEWEGGDGAEEMSSWGWGGDWEGSDEEMSCTPRREWTSVDLGRAGAPSGHAPDAAAVTPFAIYVFGADEPLESVVSASADVLREMLNEPQRPRWLPITSALPTLSAGVPNA